MTETSNMLLPLLQPSQAQKHVTVNEAIARLDAVVQLRLVSIGRSAPPAAPEDGEAWGVAAAATGDWAGQEGHVALWLNGGWAFVPAARGWRAFVTETGGQAIWDGAQWREDALSVLPSGAGLAVRSVETEVSLSAGGSVSTGPIFPAKSVVLGVSGRVVAAITGTATAWRLGDPSGDGRFGTGLGTAQGSLVEGPAEPGVAWSATPLIVTAEGGDFAGGTVRLAAHYLNLTPPDPV